MSTMGGSRAGCSRGWGLCQGVAALVVGLGLATAVGTPTARGDTLDAALLKEAPAVLRYLKDHGYQNVGVLKFRIKKGAGPASDRVGPLNLNLASHLQIALVLANDNRAPLGIIRDADAVAATLPGANHLTRSGRQVLFRGRYPLAWGDEPVEPDAFLTGVAVVSPDLKQMTVAILAFGKDGEGLEKVTQFTASTDAPTLAAAGESFLIRGFADEGRVETVREKAIEEAVKVKATPEANPLRDAAAPVALEIRYDDQPVPLEIRDGKAEIREPREGQKVSFLLRKVDRTAERYGVVLVVNGENTLFKERIAPFHARKWILSSDHPSTPILGYQTGEHTAESFRVLSQEESKSDAVHYGPEAGLITMVVFREKAKPKPTEGPSAPPPLDDKAEDQVAMSRGVLPRGQPQTLAALKFQLREGVDLRGRGMIKEGEKRDDVAIKQVEFQPDPTPVMSATVTYYKP